MTSTAGARFASTAGVTCAFSFRPTHLTTPYREYGTSWWGSYGGDGIVDLPLTLEKVIIERRPKVIYGNDLVAAKPDDVLLGDLYAEYASPSDQGDEAVRLSKLRMPIPARRPGPGEPDRRPREDRRRRRDEGPVKVTDPTIAYDGTRCHVHFEPVAGAKGYDVWVSPYRRRPRGHPARQGVDEVRPASGGDCGRTSSSMCLWSTPTRMGSCPRPSAPLAFQLKDRFGYK